MITAVFILLLLVSFLTTTLLVQGDQHPESWVINVYDISAMAIVIALYIAVMVYTFRRFIKAEKRLRE
ncbi:hypothetical protein BTJ40_12835 [Microbulbifer sp. A4B17]|nr:hypothetical protein BTJ40_12835 [Microbulbifer sp. A4B17]